MIVIVLFTALLAPYFIDWASYKKDFERETSRILGHRVEVRGETKLRLLPIPSVSFGNLTIGTNPDNTPMMSVDQFSMDIELMPMLKGEVKIVELSLVGPELNLYFDENGEIAWNSGQKLAVDPDLVKLDNFKVENGRVNIRGLANGRTVALSRLNGDISAKSLYGPWRIKGEGFWGDYGGKMDFVTGRLQDDGTIRLKASLNTPHLPFKMLLDGPLQLSGGPIGWQGIFTANAVGGKNKAQTLGVPVLSEGTFDISQNLIDVPEFRLEIGQREDPYTITGSGDLRLDGAAIFYIEARGRQIDLDRIGELNGDEYKGGGVNLTNRFGILRTIVDQIPKIPLEGSINLELPAIVAGDTLIRDVSVLVSPDVAGWNIKAFQAVIPGNTVIEAQGKVGVGDAFGFNGQLTVASRQPSGLAAWLGKRNNPYIRKLNLAGFSADANITAEQQSFDNLELKLDAALLRGNLQRTQPKNGRAKITAQLAGEQIDLDDLGAIYALVTDDNANADTYHDLDVSLKADKLSGFDITAKNIETRFRVRNLLVSIDKLNASDFLGATLTSDKTIDDVLNQPSGSFSLAVKATDPTRLLEFIQQKAPSSKILDNLAASSDLFEDLDLVFSIDANPFNANGVKGSKGRFVIEGEMGGTRVNIETGFKGSMKNLAAIELDVDFKLGNDSPAKLAMQFGLPVLPVDIAGPLEIGGSFKRVAKSGFHGAISADIGDTKFSVDGQAFVLGPRAGDASFKITHSALDITPVLVLGGIGAASLIYDSQAVITSFNGNIEIADNKITLEKGKGQINGHDFDANLIFTANTTSNHRITGNLGALSMDLPLLVQVALNSSDIGQTLGNTDGGSAWSQTNFGYPLLSGLDGEIALNVETSDFGIGAEARNLRGQLALVDGSINLNEIKGEWLGGLFDANLFLKNTQGVGFLNAQFNFYEIDGRKLVDTIGAKDFIEGQFNISGQLEGSGRSPAAIMSSLSGSGTIDMSEVVIKGINTSPLRHVFAAVDKEKFEIRDDNILPVLLQVIDQGSIKVPAVSVPYVVVVGKLRARNISVEAQGSTMNAAVEIDIKKRTQNTQLSLSFDPGKEWVDGAVPQIDIAWKGDITIPQRSIDVQPLSGFLSLRNFEKEQRRVDLLQATILEKQRLRRDVLVTNARVRYRQRLRDEELRRQRLAFLKREDAELRQLAMQRHFKMLAAERAAREEVRRIAAEVERKRLAEEARIAAELERKRLAEEARIAAEKARIAAELERKRLAEEARIAAEKVRVAAELERKRLAEEARIAAELERKRLAEEARIAAELERKRVAEEARIAAEIERKRLAEEARIAAEIERKRLAEEARIAAELKRKQLAEAARKAEAKRQRLEEAARKAEIKRQRLAEEARKAEVERLRLAEEARKAEVERQRLAEEARKAEVERKRLAEEALKAEAERLRLAEQVRKAEAERQRLAMEAARAEAERQRLESEALAAAKIKAEKAEEEKRLQLVEEERLRLAEEDRLLLAEEERLQLVEEERLLLAEEDRLLAEEKRLHLVEEERLRLAEAERLRLVEEKRLRLAEEKRLLLAEEKRREEERKRIQLQLDAPVSSDQLYQLDENFAKNIEDLLKFP